MPWTLLVAGVAHSFVKPLMNSVFIHGQHGLALTARSVLTTKAKPMFADGRVVGTSYCFFFAFVVY